jgi:glutamate/tyrosine decarboxylase-like PLP-dependent enzyme
MHVDAAYGGFAVLTERGRKALAGIERADTVTLDPHKWLYVPFECGCLLARQPRRLFDTFAIFPDYLKDVRAQGEEVNFADYGEQLTRYNRAVKVWTSVKYFGTDALAAAIDKTMDLAQLAQRRAEQTEGIEVLCPAQLGIFCFRAHPGAVQDERELDALNERVLARLLGSGRYFISTTRLGGRLSLRICVLGFRTDESVVENLIRDTALYATQEISSVK